MLPLGFEAFELDVTVTLFACGNSLGVFLIQLLFKDFGHDIVTHHAEHAVGNPVNTHCSRHNKAEPERHERHGHLHGFHGGCCLIVLLGGRHLADFHLQPGQKRGDYRDHEEANSRKPLLSRAEIKIPDPEVGDTSHIHSEEVEVDVFQSGQIDLGENLLTGGNGTLNICPVLMHDACQFDLKIGICPLGNGIPAAVDKKLLQSRNGFVGHEHHSCERLADYAVQRNQNREGDQRPETAGHRVDALFPVKLLHLFVELLLVPCVSGLQFLNFWLEPGCMHGAFFALCHKRGQNQVDRQGKEDQRNAVVPCPLIELEHQPCEGSGNGSPHRKLLK